jgi:DNA-binding NarL/FixJ family response regulator
MPDNGTSLPQGRGACIDPRADAIQEFGGEILYVDEHHLTRDCIGHELARHLPEFNIIVRATARDIASGELAVRKFVLAILYVHAARLDPNEKCEPPGESQIVPELTTFEQVAPELPRVVLSDAEVPEDIVEAFRRGVRGYVPTTLPIRQVAEAIRFVLAGGTFVPLSILSLSERPSPTTEVDSLPGPSAVLANFSPRQNEVLRRLWRGSSNKMIAYELSMCESTVKVHIRHIMKKLNVNNRTQVVLRTRPLTLDDNSPVSASEASRALRTVVAPVPLPMDQVISRSASYGVASRGTQAIVRNGSHRG